MEKRCDIGVIGLAVMGQNLVLNMNDHGYSVAVFNRTLSRVTNFLEGPAQQTSVVGTSSPADLVRSLKSPRKIMLMVRAGEVVDMFINTLWPLLDEGDIIIDGGNSNYRDTVRRVDEMKAHGILYVGAGISGGEEGARRGPSIMPGGNSRAWPEIQQIFQDIAARADDGSPCCDWVGDGGAGHFIKMVHNGIEYGDMQLISEAWHFMRAGLGLDNDRIAAVFDSWNTTELNSYLIEITADILRFREKESGDHLVDKILDSAGQKGTGKWTGISALEHGIPLTLITSAVFARCLSALKEQRVEAARLFARTVTPPAIETAAVDDWIDHLRQSLLAARIISYAQGFMLMREASAAFSWELNYHRIARIWRGGCIIRSSFLDDIANAYTAEPLRSACRCRRCRPPSPFSTVTPATVCPPACCRRSATTSAPIPISGSTDHRKSSFIPTGPDTAGKQVQRPMMSEPHLFMGGSSHPSTASLFFAPQSACCGGTISSGC